MVLAEPKLHGDDRDAIFSDVQQGYSSLLVCVSVCLSVCVSVTALSARVLTPAVRSLN